MICSAGSMALGACATAVALLSSAAPAAGAGPQPALAREHVFDAFSFRTPEGWAVERPAGRPDLVVAGGDGLLVRFLFQNTEAGFDSLHVACMTERLADPMETVPQVRYEYDFLSGTVGDYRLLDSAFVVTYDKPVLGHRQWRQRNVTLVGAGRSLCAISYAPVQVWKRSKAARALLDGVLASVTLR